MTTRRVPARVAVTAVTVIVAAAVVSADSAGGLGDRLEYLYTQLDRGAVDLRIAYIMAQDPFPEARRLMVQSIGSIADPRHLSLLELYQRDSDALVREQVMLAAGRIGPPALTIIRASLADTAPIVRQAAAWAACHGGEGAAEPLLRRLGHETDTGVLEVALGNLWRLGDGRWEAFAVGFVDDPDPRLRRAAAAGLARSGDPGRTVALTRLSGDDEPVIRATAVTGWVSGPVPESLDVKLTRALADPDWRVQVAACAVLRARPEVVLGDAGAATLARLWLSPWPHLALAAVEAATSHPAVGDDAVLVTLATTAEPWLAAAAELALVPRAPSRAAAIAADWIWAPEVWRRAAAARAAPRLPAPDGAVIAELARRDAAAAVRLAWVESAPPSSPEVRELAVFDVDPVVRAAALEAWIAGPSPSVELLLDLAQRWRDDTVGEARGTALVGALRAAPEDRRAGILATGLADSDRTVVLQVVAAARELGMTATCPPRAARHDPAWYRGLEDWGHTNRWLDLVTVRGTVRIRFDPAGTVLSAREISDLAAAGFYDGLTIHRVVPNFVVQGGDPRGDGWGGPGFLVPDEPTGRPFDSWRVGIATAGPNTGGSQLFVTLLPADRLTGHYTNLGEIVRGRDVLVRLQVGDRILRAAVAAGDEPALPSPQPQAVADPEPVAGVPQHSAATGGVAGGPR